jgi:hypothetical protein
VLTVDPGGLLAELLSKITDAVLEEMAGWLARPLDWVYPVVFIDAIHVKVRDGQVAVRSLDRTGRGSERWKRGHPARPMISGISSAKLDGTM